MRHLSTADLDEPTRIVCDIYAHIEQEKHPSESQDDIYRRVRKRAIDTMEEAMGEAGLCHSPKGVHGMTIADHKAYKGLPPDADLYDHMTVLELMLTNLYQCLMLQIVKERDSYGIDALKQVAIDAGRVAGRVREIIEEEADCTILSASNYLTESKG